MQSLCKPVQTQDAESAEHSLAGLATGPIFPVARTLSYLLGKHSTFSALGLVVRTIC
jgi:hypothetical protein